MKIVPLAGMNEARKHHSVAIVNGLLYAIGGVNENGSLITCER